MTSSALPKSVLCVDDERSGLFVRRMLLESCGYRVVTALSGEEAVELIRSGEAVDLVLLDYSMPGMNGGEAAECIRRLRPDVPLVLLTAHLSIAPQALSLFDFTYIKGQSPTNLIALVQHVLNDSEYPVHVQTVKPDWDMSYEGHKPPRPVTLGRAAGAA